ncbi:MAG: hypothetical protein QOH03_404 [Kribbellaceae bacterium]|jgi:hypothetical protein|nr:hypothetical protein [Kribbellaceae bacterium]
MESGVVDREYSGQSFADELDLLLESGVICAPEDPDGPGGPRFVDEADYYDDLPPLSAVDALEWERWAGIEQDEAERRLLAENAPAWVFLPPGAELAAALEQVRPESLSPIVLIELMKASARQTAWSESIRISAMASFYRQRQAQAAEMLDTGEVDFHGRPVDPERSWEAEIACALKVSPQTVGKHVDTALRLTRVLSNTHSALRCGAISLSKAISISKATEQLDDAKARAVESAVLKRAPIQSHANLLRSLNRQVAKYNAKDAADRHREAKEQREVRVVPLDDGMAGLWIVDTADKIQQMWIVIQAMADLAKRDTSKPGPTANSSTPGNGTHGETPDDATPDGATPDGATPDGATVDPATSDGATVGRATPDGPTAGGVDADRGAPARESLVGRRRDDGGAADQHPVVRRTAGQRRADAVADLFDFMLWNGIDWLGRRLPDQHRRRPHIEVLTPITTLLGMDDEPCELTGYGPIPAEMARRIAADGTWRRILTDPVNGTVLEASTTRHDPGMLVSETLLAAHPTCDWVNCNRAARECDRDHGIPFAQTGITRLADLRNYCELHHIIKDTPAWGWVATNNSDGSTTLTTPTGHRYTTPPATPGPIRKTPPGPAASRDEPPPF